MYTYVPLCVQAHVCTSVGRPTVNTGRLPPSFPILLDFKLA